MNTIYSSIHEMCIKRNKEIDDAILGEIKQMATENGIKTELVLHDRAIINALEKQIPKKPVNRKGTTYFYCPCCESNNINNYCADCGQALDWSDTNG